MDKSPKTKKQPCNCPDPEQCADPTHNDFNEEQMSTDLSGTPVETEPVKPRDGEIEPAHTAGVASS